MLQGLDILLAGTGLEALPGISGNAWRLRRMPQASQHEAALAPMTVTADAERGGTTEGTGHDTTRRMNTATRLPMSIHETPLSVSVITRQVMEDQGAISLEKAGPQHAFTDVQLSLRNLARMAHSNFVAGVCLSVILCRRSTNWSG